MSIADELNHLSGDIGDAYDAVDDMGGVIPAAKNMDNLDTAIRTIPQPTVNDGTLTIQKNGTSVATFTANQASNATANITVPTNTSDLNNDSGFITSSSLPGDMTGATSGTAGAHGLVPAPSAGDQNKVLSGAGTWVAVSSGGSYSAGNGINIDANNEISIDTTVVAEVADLPTDMTGATSSVAGAHGLVPAPAAGDNTKFLKGDGTWATAEAELVEMSYGENNAWAKFIAAYNAGSIVYCRASSNSNPASGSQTRKAFMAYVNDATNPTSVEFQYVRSVSSKTDSQQGDQVFVYTLTNASGGTWSVASRNMGPKINVSGPITKTFTTGASPTITIGADAMTGATSGSAGTAGYVPAPAAGDESKVLSGAGTWVSQPTVPTVNDATLTITQNGTSAGTFTANASSNTTIALTDTTYSTMAGASSGTAGTSGLVPAPAAGDEAKVLSGAGTWVNQSGGSTYTAGNGISISANDEISIDTSVVAELSDLPTVNDGTLTIQHNGTTKGTFTANQGTASTVNIETIYADTPGTATTPAASVQASDIVWSTMPFNYSTTEVDTGCTWIDGSHIYKKTINFGALPNATAKSVSHGISDLGHFVDVRAIAWNSTKDAVPLSFASPSVLGGSMSLLATSTGIDITTGSDRSSFSNCYVTLWYTKSS